MSSKKMRVYQKTSRDFWRRLTREAIARGMPVAIASNVNPPPGLNAISMNELIMMMARAMRA